MNEEIKLVIEDKLNYEGLIQKYPWIIEKKKNAILSPDSDGFLCGLFMSYFFDWNVVGFYDGKILLLRKDLSSEECIFLDVEIYRKNIRSIGHHMVLFDKGRIPSDWENFKNCIQPNNIRMFDFKHAFNRKYPLGTIHLLLGIVDNVINIDIPTSAICPLCFVDGTYQVLFAYPENVLDWLEFLNANDPKSVLHKVFCSGHYSVHNMMLAMDNFFRERDKICPPYGGEVRRERGDRLVLSDKNGPLNIVKTGNFYSIENGAKKRIETFIELLSKLTCWDYKKDSWSWDDFVLYGFTKKITRPGVGNYNSALSTNLLSLAITARDRFEYTLPTPGDLP